jgi:hypothetical protein
MRIHRSLIFTCVLLLASTLAAGQFHRKSSISKPKAENAPATTAASTPMAAGSIPTPASVFGFEPGADFHLADYEKITQYFDALAAAAPQRVKIEHIGKSGYGREMFVAIISSEDNMRQLDRYKDIVHQLASGTVDEATARQLASDGRAIVWIDGGLHATEVAGAQQSPLIGYRLASEETPEMQRIRRDVITVLCPVINPDGLDIVAHWYQKNFNTPYETAPNIELWNRYVGHDNNRDWYSFNQVESRNVAKLLYDEWLPQIVYNQHQTAPYPARIIVPPYDEPMNPNIPTEVIRGVNLVGTAMAERFANEHKPGVVSYMGFDTWWNGGMRTAPYYHNMVGILTETAGFLSGYASPGYAAPTSLPKAFPSGVSAVEPSTFYPDPWKGGWWRLRDSVDYMVTGDMAILDLASRRRDAWLYDFWKMSHDQIEAGKKGGPFAYVLPPNQHDSTAAGDMLFSLATGGVKIAQSSDAFKAGEKEFPAGSTIIYAAQPFRPFVIDLMEPQKYPDIRVSPGGPPKRPYDMTGWTLPLQMGVEVTRVDQPFRVAAKSLNVTEPAHKLAPPAGTSIGRVGLYMSWVANMDAGWTEWLFDRYSVPYKGVHDADLRGGSLRQRFDVIVLPDQSTQSLLHGWESGAPQRGEGGFAFAPGLRAIQRPEYTGGLGLEGALALQKFVEDGGQLVAMGAASDFAISQLGLPVRNTLASVSPTQFYGPGSLLRIDVDPNLPETRGMQPQSVAFFINSAAFQLWDPAPPKSPLRYSENEERDPINRLGDHNGYRVLAVYARQKPLLSGWLLGEQHVTGRVAAASVPLGKGRVVLIGFRCQFRGQSENTFPLLFNSLLVKQ